MVIMTKYGEWQGLSLLSFPTDKSLSFLLPKKRKPKWDGDVPSSSPTTAQEEIERRRERNKLRMRQIRASEDEEAAQRRRERNRMRMREHRALENEQEAERRREKNKLRMRQARAVEKLDGDMSMDHSTIPLSLVCNIDGTIPEAPICKQENLEEETETCNGESQ